MIRTTKETLKEAAGLVVAIVAFTGLLRLFIGWFAP